MDTLGAVGGELVVFALSLALMQWALRRKRSDKLFAALPLGLLPALVTSSMLFYQLQHQELPEVAALHSALMQKVDAVQLPKPEAGEVQVTKEELRSLADVFFELLPSLEFSFRLVLLAALAALLRRRMTKLGLAAQPEPLSRWTAPWGLVWLVVAPVFWMLAASQGLVQSPPWADHLAWNLLAVGALIHLFQGVVVFGARLTAWGRDPRTRALASLLLAAAAISLLLDRRGLVLMLMLAGLFEPWMDLRRLRRPKKAGDDAQA